MKIIRFLQLIRWKNLVILTSTLLILKLGFINLFTSNFSLNNFQFALLVTSILLIAAAGYIINDIYDIETDQINKPDKVIVGKFFTIKQAYNWYFFLNITGVLIGFYIANFLQKPIFSGLFILNSFLLNFYSSTLKKLPLIGNILVAILISSSILILAFFDLILLPNNTISGINYLLFELIVDFSLFAFLINLMREIIKDIQDINGDNYLNMNTLPIIIGINKSKIIIAILTTILFISLTFFMVNYLQFKSLLFLYFLIGICFPLLFFMYKLYIAKTKLDYKILSRILKIIMITGILSILLISLSIKNAI